MRSTIPCFFSSLNAPSVMDVLRRPGSRMSPAAGFCRSHFIAFFMYGSGFQSRPSRLLDFDTRTPLDCERVGGRLVDNAETVESFTTALRGFLKDFDPFFFAVANM